MDNDDADRSLRARDLVGLGGFIVGCIVAGLVVGLLLDDALGTSPVLVLVGIAVGMVAAAAGFWLRIRAFLRR